MTDEDKELSTEVLIAELEKQRELNKKLQEDNLALAKSIVSNVETKQPQQEKTTPLTFEQRVALALKEKSERKK